MDIKCPKCGKAGKIADVSIPEYGRTLNCPACKQGFIVTRQPKDSPANTGEKISNQNQHSQKVSKKMLASIITAVMVIALGSGSYFFLYRSPISEAGKNAYFALKKIEARCQAGISYRDYPSAIGEAKYLVNLYLESPNASKPKNVPFTEAIKAAMNGYELAYTIWGDKFTTYDKQNQRQYDQIYINEVKELSDDARNKLWSLATVRLITASKFIK